MAASDPEPRGAHFIQSLERGLSVIHAFDGERPHLTLSDVARATGLHRAVVRRILLTLVDLGYVIVRNRYYSLTPRVLGLGYAYLSSQTLPEVSLPHLEHLVAETRKSSSVAVLDGDEVVYVARVPTSRIMAVAISVGTRFPAHAISMGRVLLAGCSEEEIEAYCERVTFKAMTATTITTAPALRAELKRIRDQGWALVDQELEEGIRAIAVPIRDDDGHVVAAANVTANGLSLQDVRQRLLPPLLATAARIEADLHLTSRGPK